MNCSSFWYHSCIYSILLHLYNVCLMIFEQGFVGYSKDLPDCTYVAAKTGYYQTRWGLVYWHSDGSVSKVDLRDPVKCRCGYTHG
jgi:hypothetical protein